MEAGEVRSRAELARRNDLQRARVTQLMSLLGLHPVIKAYVRSLGADAPERLVTERKLQMIAKLGVERQVGLAEKHFPGFRRYLAASRVAG
jgi:hypothetical protein